MLPLSHILKADLHWQIPSIGGLKWGHLCVQTRPSKLTTTYNYEARILLNVVSPVSFGSVVICRISHFSSSSRGPSKVRPPPLSGSHFLRSLFGKGEEEGKGSRSNCQMTALQFLSVPITRRVEA